MIEAQGLQLIFGVDVLLHVATAVEADHWCNSADIPQKVHFGGGKSVTEGTKWS